MSDNASSADNQQATLQITRGNTLSTIEGESSETICQTPHTRKEIIAYLQGALHDASRNKKTRIRFVQKYPEWLAFLQELLEKIGSRSWIYREGKSRNLYALETTCKKLDFDFDPLRLVTVGEKAFYLKGFFDAEGGVPRNEKRFYIQLVQKDYSKIAAIRTLLQDLGIEAGKIHNPSREVDPDYWRIFIRTKHHRMFALIVGSAHPVKQEIFRVRMKI